MGAPVPVTWRFAKYQALGNDYLVLEASELAGTLDAERVRRICDRHRGIGADGILVRETAGDVERLRILNPDGSEAEKSGNGLRIFARYLFDRGVVADAPFPVETPGGTVTCRVEAPADGAVPVSVQVEMGSVSFRSSAIPVTGPEREVLEEPLELDGRTLTVSAATLGNPHCVARLAQVSEAAARELGPRIERHPSFPERTNVQLLEVRDRENLRIEIWERGAGYTLASGTSSCAAAAVAHRLGWCEASVWVHMPGGRLRIEIAPDGQVRLTGPAARVAEGTLADELWAG